MTKFIQAALASSVLVASVMGATAARADTATADARANILKQGNHTEFQTFRLRIALYRGLDRFR